jgi:hypothetical protein
LLGVQSTDESLEKAVTEINAKQKADDQRLGHAWRKELQMGATVGLLAETILVLLAIAVMILFLLAPLV